MGAAVLVSPPASSAVAPVVVRLRLGGSRMTSKEKLAALRSIMWDFDRSNMFDSPTDSEIEALIKRIARLADS